MSESTPPHDPSAPLGPPLAMRDQKMWATLVHIGGIFLAFLPSLVGYLTLKDRGRFVRDHTISALNFQLTFLIVSAIGWITSLIAVGVVILAVAGVLIIIFSIFAALAANRGEQYTYPLSYRFIK
ncbi:DUF4870 domain-containing protein [Glaciihabitans sp. dw_435]|uniref:DUF4870 domain-containing protein n=1 Tax=Glaciihabitans sp. dw_435 TaxID=2720081 RepID=UPI001BD67D3C|nr:DUF4870 domain-containing protein [Glaciihabitans sp. dw_435]